MVAQTNYLFRSIIFVLFIGCCLIAFGQRSKDCDNPPGGRITCESSQAAVCKVKDGKVDGYCITPPKASTETEVEAKLLTFILGEEVKPLQLQVEQKYRDIIKKGRAEVNGTVVTFNLPDLTAYVDVRPDLFKPKTPDSPRPNPGEPIRPPKR